ncbi:MAG: dolichol-phosphate mannosyltransferase [Parcubacteria group bacterium Gr01-1014_19]|nr:MAG: dolichol-phosphate mannosyltransferase [Parcubacteria group bacterium Gr01-1014_19]
MERPFLSDDCYIRVVNDGSTDETNKILQDYLKTAKRGDNLSVDSWAANEGVGAVTKKGLTILSGEKKKFDLVIKLDGDGQHNPFALTEMITQLRFGADLVIASRFHEESEQVNTPIDRLLLNRVFAGVVREITGWKITDARSGFMGMKWKYAKAMTPQLITKRYGIPMEIVLRLWKMNPEAKVTEIPHPALYGGESLTKDHRRRYQDGGETIEQKSARVAEAYAAVLRVLEDMKVDSKKLQTPS